ncbi:MAG: PDZ domain-containing protein, partial [Alphaproteobacteria bacterium]
ETVTAGIVSARGRDIGNGPLDDFLQIDAPVNQGNSGGPALDGAGHVIGVNTAILSPSGGNIGIAFAVPSEIAEAVVADLMDDGKVERGWLGVQIQEVTPDIAAALGMADPHGALVAAVLPDGPAAASGVRTGDVVVRFDGTAVDRMADLPRLVAKTPPGAKAEVVVLRDGREQTLAAVVADHPASAPTAAGQGEAQPEAKAALGLALAPIDDDTRRRYDLPDTARGVLVVGVDPAGPAAGIGLRPGDVIVQVAQDPVTTPADVQRAVTEATAAERATVLLLVERRGNARFVAVPIAKA